MPRKSSGTLEEQRNRIKREYKRGSRNYGGTTVATNASLDETERYIKQEICCYLKAQDFSYTYMADALGVHKNTIRGWFADPELNLMGRVVEIREDLINGAIKYMKTYLIEIIETLMETMRTTNDEKIVVQIGLELLDRMGISKVNKSESATAKTVRQESAFEITDKTGLLERAKHAPPHVQAKMAEAAENLISLATEHALEETSA